MKHFLWISVLLLAIVAWAGDESRCTLPVGVNGAVSTSACLNTVLSDAGIYSGDGGCWFHNGQKAGSQACRGMTVVLQCNHDVCYDNTADQGGTASCTSDYKVEFTSNKDPAYIYLRSNQSNISLRAASVDGGCNLGISDRVPPRQ